MMCSRILSGIQKSLVKLLENSYNKRSKEFGYQLAGNLKKIEKNS